MKRLAALLATAALALPCTATDIPKVTIKPQPNYYCASRPLVVLLLIPCAGMLVPVLVIE